MTKLTQKQLAMIIKPIKNNKQYEEALSAIYMLMQKKLKEGSRESDELEVLSLLVKEYEHQHFPVPKPNPINAIKFRMEQLGISEKQLADILGYRSRKSEILSGKRKLSLAMIRKLHDTLSIPAEVLIQNY
jgi:HTH-type transcriptional regulator/antitoxin HigA